MKRLLIWLATAVILVAVCVIAPRLHPSVDGADAFPVRAGIGEPAKVGGGTVTFAEITYAPRWRSEDDGDDFTLEQGFFVRVLVDASPELEADQVAIEIKSQGRTYRQSDRAEDTFDTPEAGFTSPDSAIFEVPTDVLETGSVSVGFVRGSSAIIKISDADPRRSDVLEPKP